MTKSNRKSWKNYLTKSTKGPNVYYIIGTKRSMDYDYQGGHSFKYEIYDVLDGYKIPFFKQSSGGSPGGHLTTEEIAYYFLDGGVVSSHMNVAHGCMGTWIVGIDALRFILYHFDDIVPPRKLKNESNIKT